MKFEKLYEAKKWFRNYQPFDISNEEYSKQTEGGYFAEDVNFGDWILFQHIRENDNCTIGKEEGKGMKISRPILGVFMGISVWDMALVVNIVEQPRMWTLSHELLTNPEINYYMKIGFLDPEVESFPIWSDDIYELAHWKTKPTIAQLREALKRKI